MFTIEFAFESPSEPKSLIIAIFSAWDSKMLQLKF